MRLIVDDSAAFNQLAGIGRYARHLLPALVEARSDWRYRLTYAPDAGAPAAAETETLALLPEGSHICQLPFSRRRADQLWFRARLPVPIELFVGRADAVYSPDFTCPPSRRLPRFMTIHDLAFLVYPDLTPPRLRQYLEPVVAREARAATTVLTVSEASRQDVIDRLDLDPAKVTVVPNGVEEDFFAAAPMAAEQLRRCGIDRPFVLAVGTIEPRKNHRTLFEAFRQLGPEVGHQLVVVGRRGWRADDIMTAASDLTDSNDVVFLHDVDNAALPSLYAAAGATVYPSWYEGFGLPVLESLAVGLPTVVSRVPALVEVGGDAVIVADERDAGALATAILIALDEREGTPERREHRRKRARQFSWEQSAERLAGALELGVAKH